MGGLGTQLGGFAVAAGDAVGQQHLQEIVMRQPIRSGQGEPLGQQLIRCQIHGNSDSPVPLGTRRCHWEIGLVDVARSDAVVLPAPGAGS